MDNDPSFNHELKQTVNFYFILSIIIVMILCATVYLVGCTHFYDEDDKIIQVERDGKLYPVRIPR